MKEFQKKAIKEIIVGECNEKRNKNIILALIIDAFYALD